MAINVDLQECSYLFQMLLIYFLTYHDNNLLKIQQTFFAPKLGVCQLRLRCLGSFLTVFVLFFQYVCKDKEPNEIITGEKYVTLLVTLHKVVEFYFFRLTEFLFCVNAAKEKNNSKV